MYEHEGKGRKRARALLNKSGYAVGGHLAHKGIGKEVADAAVHKHESHLHKGQPKTKLKDGGCADGGSAGKRLDRSGRKGKTIVNVVVGAGHQQPPTPMPMPMPAGAAPMPPRPMPMPPPGAGPMPGAPMAKSGGKLARGGKALLGLTAGAASGEGRLQKEDLQRKARKGK